MKGEKKMKPIVAALIGGVVGFGIGYLACIGVMSKNLAKKMQQQSSLDSYEEFRNSANTQEA